MPPPKKGGVQKRAKVNKANSKSKRESRREVKVANNSKHSLERDGVLKVVKAKRGKRALENKWERGKCSKLHGDGQEKHASKSEACVGACACIWTCSWIHFCKFESREIYYDV